MNENEFIIIANELANKVLSTIGDLTVKANQKLIIDIQGDLYFKFHLE